MPFKKCDMILILNDLFIIWFKLKVWYDFDLILKLENINIWLLFDW